MRNYARLKDSGWDDPFVKMTIVKQVRGRQCCISSEEGAPQDREEEASARLRMRNPVVVGGKIWL